MKCEKCGFTLPRKRLFKTKIVCPHCNHINKRDLTYKEHKYIGYGIGLIVLVITFIFSSFNNYMEKYETIYGEYSFLDCERIIEYDDGTISKPKTICDQLTTYFNNKDYECIYDDQIYYLKDLFSCELNFTATKDLDTYTIYLSYENGECTLKELSYTSSYEGNLGKSLDYLNTKEYDEIALLLDYSNITSRFIDIYDELKPHSENPGIQNITVEENDYYLYIKENASEDYNQVLYEYRISNY